MLVLLPATEIHFVTLHLSAKSDCIVLRIKATNLVENVPSSLLRDTQVTVQLMGGNALLMATDKVHSHKPLDEGNLGVLKDSTYGFREVVVASGAYEPTILPAVAVVVSAVRTNHITVSPTGLCDSLLALGRSVKVEGDFHEGVEVAEVNHSEVPCVLQYNILLKHRNLSLKVQKNNNLWQKNHGSVANKYIVP
jgi:hypothetical protein